MRLVVRRQRSAMERGGVTHARSGAGRLLAVLAWLLACLPITAIAFAGVADAHVKWFVTCEPSENPIPLQAVLTERFWLFSALFMALFYVACQAEQTAIGALLMKFLDRATAFLRERIDVLLRAVAAVSFSLLWVDGSVMLTPELKGNSLSLSAIQVLIPIFLVSRGTLPASLCSMAVALPAMVCSTCWTIRSFSGLPAISAFLSRPMPKSARSGRTGCDGVLPCRCCGPQWKSSCIRAGSRQSRSSILS